MDASNIIYFSVLFFFLISDDMCNSIPHNSSVISKYARVSQWGGTDLTPGVEKGRSSNNQGATIQTISVSTKKKNPSVVYHYPVYQKPQSKVDQKTEHVAGIGEVIVQQAQDRFEARPLFAYRNKLAASYGPPSNSNAQVNTPGSAPPAPAPTPPPAQLLQIPPISAPLSKPASNIYNSPFTSYNPPDFKPDDTQEYQYPPYSDSPSDDPGVLSAPSAPMESTSSSPEKPQDSESSYASLGPPLASYGDHDHGAHDYDHDYHNHVQAEDPMMVYKNNNGPPDYPPKSLDDIYYPPDFPKDRIGPNMKGESEHDHAAPAFSPDHKEHDQDSHADEADLSPPPVHNYGHSFPDYLYDHHHYDHHVYEEIPHTTMPPAKEDKRVSSTHYSYYYLGRKLWYIPLYFSVYFIIYVTVLIVKSIARHKVSIKYKWYEHDINAKQARSFDPDSVKEDEVSRIHKNVLVALKNSTAKYENITIM